MSLICGIGGTIFGGLMSVMASANPVMVLAGAACGAGICSLCALSVVAYEYHAGENYAQAMKILHP